MTLREVFIENLIAILNAAPGLQSKVERSIVTAFDREEGSVLVVHRGAEAAPDASKCGVVDRTCEILVSVVARADAPDKAADELLEIAHPLVMAFTGQEIIDVWEGQTDAPKFSDADSAAGLITVHYLVKYRTRPNTLTS